MGHIMLVFASQCESQSVGFFLMGYDISYYAAVDDIAVLGNLVTVDEEKRVCVLDIYDYLE